jgi:hypothetical protein
MKIPYQVDSHKAEKAIFDNVLINNTGIVTVLLSDFHFRSSLLSVWTVSYTSWIVFGFLAILILSRMLFRPRLPNTAFAIYRASSSFSIPSLLSQSLYCDCFDSSSVCSERKYLSNLSNSGAKLSSLLFAVALCDVSILKRT